MVLPSLSQNISIEGRVETFITEQGDTLVIMGYEDARALLEDVLHYEYADSLITVYKDRDSLNARTITLHKEVLIKMGQENLNLETIITNLEDIINNKDIALLLKDDIIKQQKKVIRKQKFLKLLGFTGSILLPVIVLIIML
jgi:hypothetical protein